MPNPRKSLGKTLEKSHEAKARSKGLSATRQPLSGVLDDFPGDVVVEDALAECKVRAVKVSAQGARMLTFDLAWLTKVEEEAAGAGFQLAYVVVRPKGSSRSFVLVGEETFLDLFSEARLDKPRIITVLPSEKVSSRGRFLGRVFSPKSGKGA